MTQQQGEGAFNPNAHLMQIKNKGGATDYLPVQWRLVWFRERCPNGTIETELVHLDLDRETEEEVYVWNNEKRRSEKVVKTAKGIAIFRAIIKDGNGGVATGTKSEKAASFPDFLEKAETGAIGRALAALGYGTQFVGDEFTEGQRIVDSPAENKEQQQRHESDARPGEVRHTPQESPQGASPDPESVERMRAYTGKVYGCKNASSLDARWTWVKQQALKRRADDPALTLPDLDAIRVFLVAAESAA